MKLKGYLVALIPVVVLEISFIFLGVVTVNEKIFGILVNQVFARHAIVYSLYLFYASLGFALIGLLVEWGIWNKEKQVKRKSFTMSLIFLFVVALLFAGNLEMMLAFQRIITNIKIV